MFFVFLQCFHFFLSEGLSICTPVKYLLMRHTLYVLIPHSHMWFHHLGWACICEKVIGHCKTEHHLPLNKWSSCHSSNFRAKQPMLFCPCKMVFTHSQEQNWHLPSLSQDKFSAPSKVAFDALPCCSYWCQFIGNQPKRWILQVWKDTKLKEILPTCSFLY